MIRQHLFAAACGLSMAGAAALLTGSPADAEDAACGGTYTVQRGETLSIIAARLLGDDDYYIDIYNANAGKIGRDPSMLAVGTVLTIPCVTGAAPAGTGPTEVRADEPVKVLPPPEPRMIRILTGGDWAPFLDEDLKDGGLFIEIVNSAMKRAKGKPKYKVDFIDDWDAHIQPLLADHAYDLGVAWFRPNCNLVEKLSAKSKFRCTNLSWSEPIFEQIVGYYTLVDYPVQIEHEELLGAKVCRPEGYSTFMMEEEDLVEPNIILLRPKGPEAAFQMLLDGKCDVVVMSVDVSETAIAKLEAADKVKLQDKLNQVASLSVVISKTHPRGEEILAAFDDGLKKIKEDGSWFRLIQRRMAEHKKRTATN